MTVRDVMHEIYKREEALNRIEKARANGFDLDVTVGQIDATKREIEELYEMEVGCVEPYKEVYTYEYETRRMLLDIARYAYERLTRKDDD